ncbi:hypothetical protein B0H19DRAFT_1253083 [Mycena capillaripes]|nr:hypothetical protein B0H19DRAFT_1253083 [Mycena capillaripes]
MFSKLVPLALCAFAVVQAVPFSSNLAVGSGISNNSYEATPKVDRSVQDTALPVQFRISNVAVKGSGVFAAAGSGEVLIDTTNAPHGNDGLWIASPGGAAGRFYIKNVGRNEFISVNAQEGNRLIVRQGSKTEFTLAAHGGGTFFGGELVWESVYDTTSQKYGYVALRRPSMGNQDWWFK